jgi:AcrR family transcriptional regulator
MPKIEARSIEEHIRQQTGRILDAAGELFTTRGYRGTDLGTIASSMGLARNSLYRYFPGKDHILVAVLEREMAPYRQRIIALADQHADPAGRVDALLELQLEIATGPCHAMMKMLGDMDEASDDLRAQIRSLHDAPRAVLESAVAELLAGSGRDPAIVCAMILNMAMAAGAVAVDSGNAAAALSELKQSVRSVLTRGD